MTALSSPQWPLDQLVAALRDLHSIPANEAADRLEREGRLAKPLAQLLQPGDVIRYRSEIPQVIRERKADDSGWWLTDTCGLNDRPFDTDFGWQLVYREASR